MLIVCSSAWSLCRSLREAKDQSFDQAAPMGATNAAIAWNCRDAWTRASEGTSIGIVPPGLGFGPVIPGNEKTARARQSTPGLRLMCLLVPWVPSLSVICSFLRVETGSGSFQEGDTSVITGPFTIGTRGPGCPRSPAWIGIVQPGRQLPERWSTQLLAEPRAFDPP